MSKVKMDLSLDTDIPHIGRPLKPALSEACKLVTTKCVAFCICILIVFAIVFVNVFAL